MAKNHDKSGVADVTPSAVETVEVQPSESKEVATVEAATTTEIPAPVETQIVVAEEPKAAVVGKVVEMVERKTPPDQRRYRLIKRPQITPKGHQRQVVLQLLLEAALAKKPDISADEMVADAEKRFNYYAAAGTALSIRWHLHQMKLAGLVAVTNDTYKVAVDTTPVTPAEVAPITKEGLAAQIAQLTEQLNKL
jgi:hypothetical protein